MKHPFAVSIALLICSSTLAQDPTRPRISGIASVDIMVSDLRAARSWYQAVLDPNHSCNFCEELPSRTFALSSGQTIHLDALLSPQDSDLLSKVTFATDDLKKLKRFLELQNVKFTEAKSNGGTPSLSMSDPEGHRIAFVQVTRHAAVILPDFPALQLIHAGFVVRDRAAMDHFYKDILGFRPYWHGGMKDDKDDWVAMQVPDGTDWVEFMLNIPADASKHTLGVMNHIALGVPDIHAAQKQLLTNGMKLTEEPKLGRDGKWQLNVYDPDDTRVEFMEFAPVEKPCCSEFTGPHPKP